MKVGRKVGNQWVKTGKCGINMPREVAIISPKRADTAGGKWFLEPDPLDYLSSSRYAFAKCSTHCSRRPGMGLSRDPMVFISVLPLSL